MPQVLNIKRLYLILEYLCPFLRSMDDKNFVWSNVSKASIFNKKYFRRSEPKMTADSKKKIEKIVEKKSLVVGKKSGRTVEYEIFAKKPNVEIKVTIKKDVKDKTQKKPIQKKETPRRK